MANFSPKRSGSPFGNFGGSSHGPILNLPRMTQILILANIAVHVLRLLIPTEWDFWVLANFAFIPLRFTNAADFTWTTILSPVTALFLHADWMHLLSNMLLVVLFGTMVERRIGGQRMLALALISGVLGNVAFFAATYGQFTIAIGASGSASGLFGAAIRIMVRQRTGRDTQQIWIFAGLWVGISLLPILLSNGDPYSWIAHVGGFLAGLLLIDSFDRRSRFRVM
jgi:membrane associated rhomboid family serine protease